ncbi:hypothetical protein TcCL_NonESM08967 [Trypanosoma cruzi]|nr:hypothetical protein TcCL_NonESM08967 [Trypanosoma cruzi]
MVWSSFTSTETFAAQSCEFPTQALKVRFGNPKANTSDQQRRCSQRPHGSSTHPQALLTTRSCDGEEEKRLSRHKTWPMGAVSTCRECQVAKQKRQEECSQWTSPATSDVRRLIRATENQRHGCCGACPCVHLTLGPMNAPRNILSRASSWPCKQHQFLPTSQRPLFLARLRSPSLSPVHHPRMK